LGGQWCNRTVNDARIARDGVQRKKIVLAMMVKINGDSCEVPDGLTVAALLVFLEMRNDRVAIEYNLNILPRAAWDGTRVQPNDAFEIVHFVGGG
jgi:sulfur carrier protein